MSSLVKYRLKEVAADFGVAPKEIAEIISKYSEKPKSNTQVLTPEELNVVFDYMTQHNQISSIEQVFAVQPKAVETKPEPAKEEPKEKKPEEKKPAAPQQQKPQGNQSAKAQPQQPQKPKVETPKEPERKRERRVVDTSAVQVNANRFVIG